MKNRSRNLLRIRFMLLGMAGLLLTSSALVVEVVVGRLADTVQTASVAAVLVPPFLQRR